MQVSFWANLHLIYQSRERLLICWAFSKKTGRSIEMQVPQLLTDLEAFALVL